MGHPTIQFKFSNFSWTHISYLSVLYSTCTSTYFAWPCAGCWRHPAVMTQLSLKTLGDSEVITIMWLVYTQSSFHSWVGRWGKKVGGEDSQVSRFCKSKAWGWESGVGFNWQSFLECKEALQRRSGAWSAS